MEKSTSLNSIISAKSESNTENKDNDNITNEDIKECNNILDEGNTEAQNIKPKSNEKLALDQNSPPNESTIYYELENNYNKIDSKVENKNEHNNSTEQNYEIFTNKSNSNSIENIKLPIEKHTSNENLENKKDINENTAISQILHADPQSNEISENFNLNNITSNYVKNPNLVLLENKKAPKKLYNIDLIRNFYRRSISNNMFWPNKNSDINLDKDIMIDPLPGVFSSYKENSEVANSNYSTKDIEIGQSEEQINDQNYTLRMVPAHGHIENITTVNSRNINENQVKDIEDINDSDKAETFSKFSIINKLIQIFLSFRKLMYSNAVFVILILTALSIAFLFAALFNNTWRKNSIYFSTKYGDLSVYTKIGLSYSQRTQTLFDGNQTSIYLYDLEIPINEISKGCKMEINPFVNINGIDTYFTTLNSPAATAMESLPFKVSLNRSEMIETLANNFECQKIKSFEEAGDMLRIISIIVLVFMGCFLICIIKRLSQKFQIIQMNKTKKCVFNTFEILFCFLAWILLMVGLTLWVNQTSIAACKVILEAPQVCPLYTGYYFAIVSLLSWSICLLYEIILIAHKDMVNLNMLCN